MLLALSDDRLPSPSFAVSSEILLSAATDVFDLHRSLLPSHFAPQLRDVPTLSMQLHNDAHHHADRVAELANVYPAWADSELVAARLRALADHAFETQLAGQREGIMEVIDEADGFASVGTDQGMRKAERAVAGVVHNVDTVARVLKVSLSCKAGQRRSRLPSGCIRGARKRSADARSCCQQQHTSRSSVTSSTKPSSASRTISSTYGISPSSSRSGSTTCSSRSGRSKTRSRYNRVSRPMSSRTYRTGSSSATSPSCL